MIVSELNELPGVTPTSKYSPVELKLGRPSGFEAYWDTVSAPGPVAAVTVTVSFAQLSFPEMTEHDVWLLAPVGGVGAVGAESPPPPPVL